MQKDCILILYLSEFPQFLSMKLASVIPNLEFNIDEFFSTEVNFFPVKRQETTL